MEADIEEEFRNLETQSERKVVTLAATCKSFYGSHSLILAEKEEEVNELTRVIFAKVEAVAETVVAAEKSQSSPVGMKTDDCPLVELKEKPSAKGKKKLLQQMRSSAHVVKESKYEEPSEKHHEKSEECAPSNNRVVASCDEREVHKDGQCTQGCKKQS